MNAKQKFNAADYVRYNGPQQSLRDHFTELQVIQAVPPGGRTAAGELNASREYIYVCVSTCSGVRFLFTERDLVAIPTVTRPNVPMHELKDAYEKARDDYRGVLLDQIRQTVAYLAPGDAEAVIDTGGMDIGNYGQEPVRKYAPSGGDAADSLVLTRFEIRGGRLTVAGEEADDDDFRCRYTFDEEEFTAEELEQTASFLQYIAEGVQKQYFSVDDEGYVRDALFVLLGSFDSEEAVKRYSGKPVSDIVADIAMGEESFRPADEYLAVTLFEIEDNYKFGKTDSFLHEGRAVVEFTKGGQSLRVYDLEDND